MTRATWWSLLISTTLVGGSILLVTFFLRFLIALTLEVNP